MIFLIERPTVFESELSDEKTRIRKCNGIDSNNRRNLTKHISTADEIAPSIARSEISGLLPILKKIDLQQYLARLSQFDLIFTGIFLISLAL